MWQYERMWQASGPPGLKLQGDAPRGGICTATTSRVQSPGFAWRSVGAVGNPSVYTFENDIGPDGANHDRTGVFAMAGSPGQPTGKVDGLSLVDVGPTILSLFGIQTANGASRSFL